MSKTVFGPVGLAALGVAAALLLPAGGAVAAHHHHGFAHHRHNDASYGGVIEAYPFGGYVSPVSVVAAAPPMTPLIAPVFGLTCHHSQQIVTVPSEDGGERKITITRC
jgi:hypothetical protein